MFWLSLAIALLAVEALWRKGYAFWWAMIAFGAYLWALPIAVFLFLATFASILWSLYFYRKPRVYEALAYDRDSGRYIGREFVLTQPMKNGVSEIEFDDMIWPVYSASDQDDWPMGTLMKVKRTNGVILMVAPLSA